MQQIKGTTKKHTFAIVNGTTGVQSATMTNPTYFYRINGETTAHSFTPTIGAYELNMKTYSVSISSTLAIAVGDTIEVYIHCNEGDAHLMIDVIDAGFDTTIDVLRSTTTGTFGNLIYKLFKYNNFFRIV